MPIVQKQMLSPARSNDFDGPGERNPRLSEGMPGGT